MLHGICSILELKPFLLSCCMVVATVGNFTGQGICSIVDSFWMVLAAKWRHPKKKTKISNQSERCNQILACVVYNDHARPCLPRSTYYNKNWKNWRAAGAERSLLLDCFLYSVLLRCGFEILLLVAGWCLCQGCSRTKQHDQLTKATRSQRTEDQRTRRPGTRQPGTRRPKDQGTKRTRRSPGRSRKIGRASCRERV